MYHIPWMYIHKIAFRIGAIISAPFSIFPIWIRPERDNPDYWSFAHSLATAIIMLILFVNYCSLIHAFLYANLIMFLYEVIIDGRKIEDKRGSSRADIGYNFIGSILVLFVSIWRQ